MTGTLRQILSATIRIDGSQFEGLAAVRCAVGVAIPLIAGLLVGQPSVSAFGGVGAVSVGFGSFQGAYRSRAAVMLYAAAGMAVSVFVGSLSGHSDLAAIVAATIAAFASGMLVAVGPAAAFVGLQCVVAVLIAGGFPAEPAAAAMRAVIVFGGGLVQTLLVALIWPLRRFSVERRAIAGGYRSIGAYASQLPSVDQIAPEPHTFAAMTPPVFDPQPFARTGDVLVFQALQDEAERIRASLASFASEQRRLVPGDPSCATLLPQLTGQALVEIADALEHGRAPTEATPIWEPLERCAAQLPRSAVVDALLGQIRAAWRTAGVLTSRDPRPVPAARPTPLRARPPVRDALTTLASNLTLESNACRHALRVSATVALATAGYRLLHLSRGYWMPMTALLVLKPEFHDTFARGVARIAGTLVGAALATVIVNEFAPGSTALTVLVLVCVWACYAVFRMNYTIFTIAITGYVVFILMLSGIGEMTAASSRALDTAAGGLLALCAYAIWPTWAGATARSSLADMFEAHSAYIAALLGAYADPGQADTGRLAQLRATARLARSNLEAVVERMLAEPRGKASMSPRVALGVLAALRRHALAALSLHAGVERGIPAPVAGMSALASEMSASLVTLADAVRAGQAPSPLPPMRQTQLALAQSTSDLVREETDLMVDGVNTIAELLTRDAS